MLAGNKITFFILVFWNKNLSAIKWVSNGQPKCIFTAFQSFRFVHFPYLFCIELASGKFFEYPFHDFSGSLFRVDILFPGFRSVLIIWQVSPAFQLFNGVFGASDEVLGRIESGVDFEKRIARIYQEYRRPEEIKEAFDLLQKELEPDIELKMDVTKKQLLENFDEEVHQKLKFKMEKGKECLNQYEQWLWNITRFYLQDYAEFNYTEDSFRLKKNPTSSFLKMQGHSLKVKQMIIC